MPPNPSDTSPTQEVERWNPRGAVGFDRSPNGAWVPFEKHQKALQAEVEKREEVEGERREWESFGQTEANRTRGLSEKLEAAESRISTAVEELERRAAEEATAFDAFEAQDNRVGMAICSGRLNAFTAAALLLRDEGDEQGGAGR